MTGRRREGAVTTNGKRDSRGATSNGDDGDIDTDTRSSKLVCGHRLRLRLVQRGLLALLKRRTWKPRQDWHLQPQPS
jgi:hypothetical protein